LFGSGFDTDLGDVSTDGRLTTLHSSLADLSGLALASGSHDVFGPWIQAVAVSGASYDRLDRSTSVFDVGDPDVTVEILGPILEPGGTSLAWLSDKSYTINGHSLVFRVTHGLVRTFFSGDLNEVGGNRLLGVPNATASAPSREPRVQRRSLPGREAHDHRRFVR
jgi:hypothetical protein